MPGFTAPKKKSKSKNNKNTETVAEQNVETTEHGTKLPSKAKTRTYFYKIDESIVSGVENGSPESIKLAVSKLRKSDGEYAENEKVLMNVAAEIMHMVWPSEKTNWETFDEIEDNSYTGSINSAKNGIFDSSTGNVDFLSTTLPILVILTQNISPNVYEQCEPSVQAALELNPDSLLINYLAGILYKQEGDYPNAEKYLQLAYEKSSNVLEVILAYSDVLVLNKKAAVAFQVIASVPAEYDEDILVLKERAKVSFVNKDYSSAEKYVAKVLQKTPNDLDFLLFRAKIFIEKKDYIHAVSLLDMYARQNDTNVDYLILRAKVQLDWSKNTNAATETVEKALRLYPENEELLMLATRISSVTDSPVAGKYADELASYVLKANPDNKEALIYAMEGLIQRENWNEAYKLSSQLILNEAASEEVILNHVRICTQLKKYTEALETATNAYRRNPENEIIMQAYVIAYCSVNSNEEALNLINGFITASSSKMKSYLYYQRSFLQHTEEAALADLRSSLIANPRNSDSLFRLYEIYYEKEDYRKAQYYLRQVVAINPNDSSIRKLNEALTQLVK
ncbi:MAG: hypothetical protein K6G09_11705 [Treponema sp.]|nr:hypothetical protein [Treponema sp.]